MTNPSFISFHSLACRFFKITIHTL
uniref:Uncharacterized protein n=1 Tax=Anguilla anguilla TaxID=7936 RepID=A0A0E9RLH7_ANGAN